MARLGAQALSHGVGRRVALQGAGLRALDGELRPPVVRAAPVTVSVVMPIYRAAEYLPAALGSVVRQTYEDWELFAVDDGSQDRGVDAALDRVRSDRRVTVVQLDTTDAERAETVRYATIINRCAALGADYLTFLCGDDFYYPDRLERMVAKLDLGLDVVYGAQRLLHEDGTEFGVRSCQGVLANAYHQVDLNSVMLTRTAFEAVGGFPDTPPTAQMWREADAHFWNRLTGVGYVFVPVDDPERPTDCKRYRSDSVDMRVRRGETPW